MQCTNNIPSHNHSRDLNLGATGFAWHLSSTNGEERGPNVLIVPSHVDQYLVCNKEVMRQTMQSHEATFRYQVQELHRLYRRQNEMMNEVRMGEIIPSNFQSDYLLSGSRFGISQTEQDTTSWIRGTYSDSKLFRLTSEKIQQPSFLVAKNFQKPAPLCRKDITHEIHDLPYKNRVHGIKILNHDNPVNVSEAFEASNASNSGHVLTNTGELLSCNSNSRKRKFWIDLNEPIQLDEPASSFIPPSDTHEKSEVPNSEKCHFAIDLNSVPDISLPEENEIDRKFLKIDTTFIDLNAHNSSLPLSNTNTETKEQELEAPVSPENKEASPPRGKSLEIQQHCARLDEAAAESLIMISSYGVNNIVKSVITERAGDFFDSLFWFAEVALSIGDDEVNNVTSCSTNDEDENCETLCRIITKENESLGRSVQRKLQKESRASMHFSKFIGTSDFSKSGLMMMKNGGSGKNISAKQRKYLTLSSSDVVKKHRSKNNVLPSWGTVKKRTARKYLVVGCRL